MQHLGSLLHKRMTRKQFLQTIGMLLLTVVGLGALLRYVQPGQKSDSPTTYGQ